jgi:hypothetical protein
MKNYCPTLLFVICLTFGNFFIAVGQVGRRTPEQLFNYYWINRDIIEKSGDVKVKEAISGLKALQNRLCAGGCRDFRIYYLLGRFNCVLNNSDATDDFNSCLDNSFNLSPRDKKYIENCKTQCTNVNSIVSDSIGIPQGNGPNASSYGDLKRNYPNSLRFSIDRRQYQNGVTYYNLFKHGMEAESFEKDDRDSALKVYADIVDKGGFQMKLKGISNSEDFLLFSKSPDDASMLKVFEENLVFYQKEFGLKKPEQLIVIFLIPENELNEADKAKYKFKFSPHIRFPWHPKQYEETQQGPESLKISLGYHDQAPPYLFKTDFLKFAQYKDGFGLDEGTTGYANPNNYTIVTYDKNYLGAINHEIMHLVITYNYPGCTKWLNEGLACLFEAANYNPTDQTLIPINNFRIGRFATYPGSTPYSVTLHNALTLDWNTINDEEGNYLDYVAFSRYFCFYLSERNLLKPLMVNVMANIKPGKRISNNDLLIKILEMGHFKNFDAMEADFEGFVNAQKLIVFDKNGKFKKEYDMPYVGNDEFF